MTHDELFAYVYGQKHVPSPTTSNGRAAWDIAIGFASDRGAPDSVIALMVARDRHGFEKYGVRLQAGNGRPVLVDAFLEALDLLAYLSQAKEESPSEGIDDVLDATLDLIVNLYGRIVS